MEAGPEPVEQERGAERLGAQRGSAGLWFRRCQAFNGRRRSASFHGNGCCATLHRNCWGGSAACGRIIISQSAHGVSKHEPIESITQRFAIQVQYFGQSSVLVEQRVQWREQRRQ